jgi:hypothetical protein
MRFALLSLPRWTALLLGALALLGAGCSGNKTAPAATSSKSDSAAVEKMMAKALESKEDDTRLTLLQLVAETVGADGGLAASLPLAVRIPEASGERDAFYGFATAAAAKANLDATLATLKGNPKLRETDEVVAAIGPALAKSKGPKEAVAWITANVPEDHRTAAFGPIAEEWVTTDPVAAATWAHSLADPGPMSDLAMAWGEKDMAGAVKWIKANTSVQDQLSLMPTVFDSAAEKKAVQASQLAIAELSPDVAKVVLPALASAIAENTTSNPAAWYDSVPEAMRTQDLRVAVASGWLGRDPTNAIAWLQKITPEKEFDATWAKAVDEWATSDSDAVEKWLKTAPAGKLKESALTSYALQQTFSDAESAKKWAAQIADPVEREKTIKEIEEMDKRIQQQIKEGAPMGMVFMGEDGKPMEHLPQGMMDGQPPGPSIPLLNGLPGGPNTSAPPAGTSK